MVVILRIITANIFFPVILKNFVGRPGRLKRLVFQFLFCFIISIGIAFFLDEVSITKVTFFILSLGFIHGFAAYCQWLAIDISLSRNYLFTFWEKDRSFNNS